MAKVLFGAGQGLRLRKSDTLNVDVLFGTSAPGGDTGEQDAAALGSLFILQNGANSTLYQKIGSANALADWKENGSASAQLGNWRPERVDAHTGDVLSAGNIDPLTFSDNDGAFDFNNFVVGHYILDGGCDLWEITAVGVGTGSDEITLAAAANAPVADDMFAVKLNLPDPLGQEGQAIITFDGAACIKVADMDWEFATGINLSGSYTPASGNITSADSVEGALEKLDGNNDDQDLVLGTAQGAVDLGTFTGATIADNVSVKAALQALETAYEETDANVDDLISLSGVAENATDLGTFTGATIPDAQNNKQALQALETAHETLDSSVTEIDANVDDLITLSGVAENSTDLGTFTGATIPDAQNNKQALQALETAYEETDANVDDLITLSGVAENSANLGTFAGNLLGDTETVKSALGILEDGVEGFPQIETGVSSATVIDSVLVDDFRSCLWLVSAFDEANPADVKAGVYHAINDGTSGADAANADISDFGLLKVGGNFNDDVSVSLNGAGAAQAMQLSVNSSEVGVTYTAVRLGCTPSGY